MSRTRKPKTKKTDTKSNIGRKFRIFVKPVDENGFPDEDRFGWISSRDKHIELMLTWDYAIVFEEKEDGHGSFEDWKRFFESEYKDWKILNGPSYLPDDSQCRTSD